MRCGLLKEGMAMRRSGKVYVLLAIVVGAALCAFAVFVIARRPTAAARPALYPYPPNARQLIAAGLTGRPAAASPTSPVSIDMVLVDGIHTTLLFHVLEPANPQAGGHRHPFIPFITLRDDHGQTYQPQGGTMTGLPVYVGSGWRGSVESLFAFFRPSGPARGDWSFASLPWTAHAAFITVTYAGQVERMRVPLRLTALKPVTTVTPRITVTRGGVVVRLRRVSRARGSAQLSYTLDTSLLGGGMPMLRDTLSSATGRSMLNFSGSGSCGVPAARPARMSCSESWVFAPPPRGTRLTLAVALLNPSGRGALPGSPWRVSFTMP